MKFERPRHSEGAVAEGLIIVEPLPRKVAVSSLSVYGRFDEKGPFRSPRPREVQLLGEEDQLRQQQTGPGFGPEINFLRRVAAVAGQRLEVFGDVPVPGIKAAIQKQLSPLEPRPQPRERRATGNQSP